MCAKSILLCNIDTFCLMDRLCYDNIKIALFVFKTGTRTNNSVLLHLKDNRI